MKKFVGILGLLCLVSSGLMVVGCGKSDEGNAPKAATDVQPVGPDGKPPKNGGLKPDAGGGGTTFTH